MRFALRIEYRGTDFAGWQVQPGQRTVQGEIEAALERFVGHAVRVSVSGRTDAGVHAEGQVISFETGVERTAQAVFGAMNAMLPADIAVLEAWEAPEEFDPRRWSWGKHYRYRWLDRPARSPLRAERVWHLRHGLDVEAMHEAAQALAGRHDFTSFRAAGCSAPHAVREVSSLAVRRSEDEVWLEVRGNGFLRHMVRIIAGTLTEVGCGRKSVDWVSDVLAAQDRTAGGRTAPARGLTLVSVTYGDGPPPWHR